MGLTIGEAYVLATQYPFSGYLGSALSNSTNQVAGQATINPLLCDPTMLYMAIMLADIDKKLDSNNIESY